VLDSQDASAGTDRRFWPTRERPLLRGRFHMRSAVVGNADVTAPQRLGRALRRATGAVPGTSQCSRSLSSSASAKYLEYASVSASSSSSRSWTHCSRVRSASPARASCLVQLPRMSGRPRVVTRHGPIGTTSRAPSAR
jgi:hypothetical protein